MRAVAPAHRDVAVVRILQMEDAVERRIAAAEFHQRKQTAHDWLFDRFGDFFLAVVVPVDVAQFAGLFHQLVIVLAGEKADIVDLRNAGREELDRSEEHTSELQSLMRISYAVFCLKKKNTNTTAQQTNLRHNKTPHTPTKKY